MDPDPTADPAPELHAGIREEASRQTSGSGASRLGRHCREGLAEGRPGSRAEADEGRRGYLLAMEPLICPHCGKNFNEVPKRRSTGPLSQNHHFNGHCAQVARETGNDFEDVKLGIKARAIKRGFPEPRIRRAGGRTYEVWKSERLHSFRVRHADRRMPSSSVRVEHRSCGGRIMAGPISARDLYGGSDVLRSKKKVSGIKAAIKYADSWFAKFIALGTSGVLLAGQRKSFSARMFFAATPIQPGGTRRTPTLSARVVTSDITTIPSGHCTTLLGPE